MKSPIFSLTIACKHSLLHSLVQITLPLPGPRGSAGLWPAARRWEIPSLHLPQRQVNQNVTARSGLCTLVGSTSSSASWKSHVLELENALSVLVSGAKCNLNVHGKAAELEAAPSSLLGSTPACGLACSVAWDLVRSMFLWVWKEQSDFIIIPPRLQLQL